MEVTDYQNILFKDQNSHIWHESQEQTVPAYKFLYRYTIWVMLAYGATSEQVCLL